MLTSGTWVESGEDKFTRFWAWFYYNPIEDVDEISTWCGETPVYQFSSDSNMLAQATFVNTIIINEQKLSSISDFARKVIVEHEIGHLKRRPSPKGLLIGLIIWIAAGLLLMGLAGLMALLVPYGFPIETVLEVSLVSIAMLSIGVVGFRLEEIAADFHVLEHISYDEYLSVHEEIGETVEPSLMDSIVTKLLYTNPETIIRLHRFKQGI